MALHGSSEFRRVADVALDDFEPWMFLRKK
jgi:hypothetical protein